MTKIKVMEINNSDKITVMTSESKVQVEKFGYLGSTLIE